MANRIGIVITSNDMEAGKVTVTYNDDIPTFTVKVKDFKNKMKTWPSGKFVTSESFLVNGVPLSLTIYPNGNIVGKDEGKVSVFLKNNNIGRDIQVYFTLKMKGMETLHSQVDIGPNEGKGTTALYCHKGVANIGSDDDTKISCTIRILKKYVSNITLSSSIETIQTSTNELKRKYDSIESKVHEGNSNIEKRIAKLEAKIEASSESIKSKIDVSAASARNNNVVKPKCPICFEEMSSKIAQCISGHFLCWPCKEKMGDKDCAFCDQPVNGRCYGMEAYLRTIFG